MSSVVTGRLTERGIFSPDVHRPVQREVLPQEPEDPRMRLDRQSAADKLEGKTRSRNPSCSMKNRVEPPDLIKSLEIRNFRGLGCALKIER
jgi:hypothetical protein